MNQIERLRDDLARRFPGLPMAIDAPADPLGTYHLDVRREGAPPVVVEWRSDRGFGVSTPDDSDFGTGPDEVHPNARSAFDRLVQLVLSNASSAPPTAVRLADLRRGLGLSQAEVAGRAGVGQSNLSQIEARAELKVGTLARIVEAMGATLVLQAVFPDGTSRRLDLAAKSDTGPE